MRTTDVKYLCFVVVLEMYLHLTDVQRGRSTSTQGKAPLVTVRYGFFILWFRYVLICTLFILFYFLTYIIICSHNCHFQNKNWDAQRGKLSCFTWLTCCTVLVPESTPAPCSLVSQAWSVRRTGRTAGHVLPLSPVIQPLATSPFVLRDNIPRRDS